MAYCSAYGCKNNIKSNKDKSFFLMPKNPEVSKAWIAAINRTKLPAKVFLCSDHFEETCFDPSWKLQNELFYKDRPCKRRLIQNSVPTICCHKTAPKERTSSTSRAKRSQSKDLVKSALVEDSEQLCLIDNEVEFEVESKLSIGIQAIPKTQTSATQYKDTSVRSTCTQTLCSVADAQTQTQVAVVHASCQTENETDTDNGMAFDFISFSCLTEVANYFVIFKNVYVFRFKLY
ncbi:THAP domain-containing protein 10-like [Hydractinia symbiolongicarpus]|uniref:THAP domain-containing protein 10-like n=1 Tax=Hydractinia symbiolongicarpus TaxID=13093 RepID=UPI00254A3BD0|nr:THAP domain-containing protein 10-like [Hydractinia symbiolongicarpus]